MGSVGAKQTLSKDDLRARLKDLRQEYKDFYESMADEDGYMELDASEARELRRLQDAIDETTYELHKQLNPVVSDDKWKGQNITALTREEAEIARKDMLKNKSMFLAISSAQHGVFYGDSTWDTEVDKLYNNNPTSTYNIFKNTRDMLQKKYGDTMTLYRVQTQQTPKATVNMTSTRANAEQYAREYGGKVESIQVPVKDILAVNITRTGAYEEFIVLRKGRR